MNLHAFPNPFVEHLSVAYELEQAQNISIKVLNLAGTEITTLFDGFQSPGVHKVHWSLDERLPPGGYLIYMLGTKASRAQFVVFSE